MVPVIQVAVRDQANEKHLFHIQSEEAQSYLEVVRLVLREFPKARSILMNMPVGVDH